MAVQLILQRAGGGTINLYNKNAATLSTVIRAEQKQSLLGEDVVNITVESAVKIPFTIGDKTTIFGRDYKINRLPKPKKTGNRLFTYDIELEGVQYDLMRATYDLNIDTTNNELQDVQADTLTGDLERFATVLIANANRVFPSKWALGDFPDDTEDKTLTFGETDNCLSVLQRLCQEYGTEFDIAQVEGVNTINFGKAGQIFPYTFEYGKGKGLYELERQNVSSANIVTRLKVFGGTRNVTYKYHANRLCLPGKTKGQSYIEKPDAVAKYGIWEATKHFNNIYPSRTGTITGLVSGSVLEFVDNTMNFDLNEKELDGITTKYLLDGVAAKIHFNSGNLSGFEFELQAYDHATKTFTLKPFKDERDETYPSEKSEAFQFTTGDKYVILDIALPQTYIDEAEARLAAEGDTYYDQNSQPKVQYSLAVAEEFLKSLSGVGGTANIFQIGDYLPVKDADIDVDKSVRIQGFTRDLIDEFKYQLTISDTVTTNITNRVISELIDIDKVIKINNLKDPAKARRDWRSAQELLDMIFDVEGDYYSEKIKPGSIETQMLSVGAKSTQFGLVGTVIQANYNGNKNSVNVKGGVLTHYTIEEDGRIWNLADNTTTLTGDSTPYYIYAKCQRVGTAGSIIFSTEQIKVEQDPDFYHFFVGVVNSVDPGLNVRSVALTYGFTTVNGRYVRTGRIQSNDGTTYFDLDLGEIGGKIKFVSGGSQTDLSDWADDISGDIQDTQQAASDAGQKAQQALDEAANIVTDFNAEIAGLQQQIDGEVSNWFYPYSPTLSNYPASDWTTDAIKDRHIGDTFTNTQPSPAADAGKSWRFVKNGSTYSWTQIADSDAVKALQQAAQAQATADGKSTTFLVQPTKYHLGDTWVLNADRTINGTAYKQGEILTATQDSTTFVEAHWIKRVRYTDDTAVENLQIGGRNLIAKKYIREWNDVNSNITLPGTDADGDYLAINQANLYQYVGGLTAHNDIFQGKIKYKENTQYALKVRWRLAASQSSSGLYLRFKYTDGTSSPWLIVSSSQTTVIEQSLISAAGKTVSGINCTYGTNTNRTLIYDIQLTEGNKQTAGYIVAPEDVQAEIDEAKQAGIDAQNAVETTNTNVTNLNDYVDGAFKDGVVSESEAKAIEKYINIVNADKDAHDATYNKLYTNTYLEGAAKTNLLNSKISYNGAIDNLLSAINAAIADGKVTPAEKNTVDTRYSEYRSALSTFNTRIEEANKAIQDKLDSLSTQKVNDLQIGGTNLIPKSRGTELGNYANGGLYAMGGYTLSIYGGDSFRIASPGVPDPPDNQNNIRIATGKTLQLNETYTLSFEAMTSSSSDRNHNIRMPYSSDNIVSIKTGDWQKYFFTFKITNENTVNGQNNYFFFWQQNQGIYVTYLRKVKLEKGNKPTDWDEAQEDVQGRIDSAKQEALTAAGAAQSSANAAQNAANSLKDFSDAAFADGVINRAERAAIEKYKNSVNETKLTVDSGYTQVYNNTYLEGTPKTNLLNAKTALNTAYTNLINSIDTAIADNITTPAEKADVDAKFGLFNTALATYQVRLEEANKAIQAKLDAISKGYVDNLQIGGKNLIQGTNTFSGYNAYQGSTVVRTSNYTVDEWKANDATRFQVSGGTNTIKLLKTFTYLSAENRPVNPLYVLSVYIKNLGDTNVLFFGNPSSMGSVTVLPGEAVRAIIYYDYAGGGNMQFQFRGVNADTGFDIALWHDQIEEGNKVSAWSRSDYDVKAEIDNAAQIAADAQAKANISKAITDKFGTTVDGGLIGTVMILLRELNSLQETAGLSGIQGALMNNPAFWAGGTSAKALALIQFLSKMSAGTTPEEDEYGNLAKITLLHDGAAKIGDFIIEKTGRISMIDPSTAKQRLVFSTNNIPSAAELEGTATGSGSATNAFKGLTYPATEYTFPNKINVTKEGSDIKVETFISFSWDTIGKEFYGWATFNLFLDRNGSEYMHVDSAMVQRQSGGGGTSQDSKSISKTIQNCPSGEYSLRITIVKATVGDEPANIIGSMNQSTLSWQFTGSSIKRIEFGLDGLFALWDNFLFHISQHTGLTIKGGVNMPGILAAGRVNSAGSMDSYWRGDGGVITSVRTSNPGLYTITHGLGRTNYFPQITPIVEDVNFKISAINANNFVVDTYHVNAHTRWNSAFIFTIFGNNYG